MTENRIPATRATAPFFLTVLRATAPLLLPFTLPVVRATAPLVLPFTPPVPKGHCTLTPALQHPVLKDRCTLNLTILRATAPLLFTASTWSYCTLTINRATAPCSYISTDCTKGHCTLTPAFPHPLGAPLGNFFLLPRPFGAPGHAAKLLTILTHRKGNYTPTTFPQYVHTRAGGGGTALYCLYPLVLTLEYAARGSGIAVCVSFPGQPILARRWYCRRPQFFHHPVDDFLQGFTADCICHRTSRR